MILDRVWPLKPTDESTKSILHWQFDLKIKSLIEGNGVVNMDCEHNGLLFLCAESNAYISTEKGSKQPFDGRISRYYNAKSPVQAINYLTESINETWFLSVISQLYGHPEVNFGAGHIEIDGSKEIDLQAERDLSDEMIIQVIDQ